MSKSLLSVVLITYNEESNIKDCLQSIGQLADEIIVVDGQSKDKTRQIAKAMGAKVFKVPNIPNFDKNKQIGINKAKSKWILQLDADERLTPKLSQEISKVIKLKKSTYAGYNIPRKNWFLTRFLTKGGQYPDYVTRLFLKNKGSFSAKKLHQQATIKGKIGYLKNDLIHLSDTSFSRYLMRFNRYTSFDARDLQRHHHRPSLVIAWQYLITKPISWFFSTYFRHKGFVDGLPGFIFSLMSSFRFPIIFIKFWELNNENSS